MTNPRPAQSRSLKAWHAKRTDEEKQATSEKRRRSLKAWYAGLTGEEQGALAAKLKQSRRDKMQADPAAYAAWKRKNSEAKRALFTDPQVRENVGKNFQRWHADLSPEAKEKDRKDRSERFKIMWAGRSQTFREEIAAKQSASIAEWWASAPPEAYAERAQKARLARPTKPEREMSALLTALGVEFRFEYPIDRYCVDFYVPARNLVIEVDGEYWHRDDRAEHDRKRDLALRALGYTVCRVWAKQVGVPETRSRLLKLVS